VKVQRLVLALAMAGVLAAAAAAAAPKARVLQTTTPVSGLAADGSTFVVATAWSANHCERVVAWNPVQPSLQALGRTGACPETSTGRGILEQAIAGRRVAWLADGGGNQHQSQLWVASLANPKVARRLAATSRDIDTGAGTYAGGVRGAGSLLVYATWSVCDAGDTPFKACPAGVTPGTIYNSKLYRVDGTTGAKLIASAPDELLPLSVAGGRILVQLGDGTLELRGADGNVIRTFNLDGVVQQAALGTTQIVAAVRVAATPPVKAKLELEVYSVATGALVRTLPTPTVAVGLLAPRCSYPTGASAAGCDQPSGRLRFGNVLGGQLVYVLDTTVHEVWLTDGHEMTYTPSGSGPVYAVLAQTGMAHAFRISGGGVQGAVGFVPFQRPLG
jgi:hypothetical protein